MDNSIILYFVTVTIFSLMFAMGINHSYGQLTSLWREPKLLLRSLAAVIVLVPLAAILLLWLLPLSPPVAAGLAILAAAPGAPLTTKRSHMAGGDPTYAASLQLTLAMLAVLVTPLTLRLFYALFDLPIERISPFRVLLQVGEITFFPVIAGLLIQRFAPGISTSIARPVQVIANALFLLLLALVVMILAFASDVRQMLNLGGLSLSAILIMAGAALAIGHFSGGPRRQQRSALAVACVARNVGLALFIAALFDYGQQFIPTMLAYMILGGILAFPYGAWIKRQIAAGTAAGIEGSDR